MKPSRRMIPGEISWAYIALCFAWAGAGFWPFDDAYLNRVLEKNHWEWLWLVFMGLPAAALMFVSGREHILSTHGRCNSMIEIDICAKWRARFTLILAGSWLYAVYVLILIQKRPSALMMVALGGLFFMLWAWGENKRVRRDVKKQTGSFSAPAAR